MDKKEFSFTIILIIVGIAGLFYSILLPTRGIIALSPGLFPASVSTLMIILGIVRLFQMIQTKNTKSEKIEGERNFLMTISLFLVYLLLLSYIHFIASTLIFLFASMIILYKRFYWKIPIISITSTIGIYSIFRYLLNVRLP